LFTTYQGFMAKIRIARHSDAMTVALSSVGVTVRRSMSYQLYLGDLGIIRLSPNAAIAGLKFFFEATHRRCPTTG
jgi:hypothetical protein